MKLFTIGTFIIFFVCMGWADSEFGAWEFHVAPDGCDSHAGTLDQPFATLERAQKAVRKLTRQGLDRPVVVYLHDGEWELEKPLLFEPQDGGDERFSVMYQAYPDAHPTVSGGHAIGGWRRTEGNLWVTDLPEVKKGRIWFRQLFADGERLPRGRYPNGTDLLHIASLNDEKTNITFAESLPFDSLQNQVAEIIVIQNWAISRSLVLQSDSRSVVTKNPVGWIGHGDALEASPGKPVFLEHALAFVDRPGEWHLDRTSGRLTYCAAVGENPNQRRFIAPRVEMLLHIQGEPRKPVRNLQFRGITFEYAEWPLPEIGYMGIQAGHFGTHLGQPYHVTPSAVCLEYAAECGFERCRVQQVGAGGIGFGAGCFRNRVIGCTIEDIGGNGVMVGWRERERKGRLGPGDHSLAADWEWPYDAPVANEIAYCTVTNCGVMFWGSVGIFDAFAVHTRIAHNHVFNLPYTGISSGYRWDSSPSNQRGGAIEYNHIHDVMLKLADGGGIYTLGYQPNAVIRGNHIHDIHRSEFAQGGAPNNGVFIDQGSKGFLFERNVIYQTSGDPIRFNQCTEADQEWRENWFRLLPTDPDFPKEVVDHAGTEPAYRPVGKE